MGEHRRLGIRFWWEVLQFAASGLVLLVLVVGGIWFVFAEGLPWLGAGVTNLLSGDFNFASIILLTLIAAAVLVLVGGLAGFGAELGRGFAVRLRSKRNH
jgi:hypothetical protein